MNGCGGRWLQRLSPAARLHRSSAIHCRALPCYAARGSRCLSRVIRRRPVSRPGHAALESEPPLITPGKDAIQAPIEDDTTWLEGPSLPRKEAKDAEGRTYFMSGFDWNYHYRHSRSQERGHIKAAYTARNTFLDPSTKTLEYKRPIKRPLLILYNCNFVEDDEFWDEVCVLCDFATSITERDKCIGGHSPEKDSIPVEFIYVQARFHYNAKRSDDPWHITVDFGTRRTWNHGDGFLRRAYHIYAKNDDLSQGYAGYRSPTRIAGSLGYFVSKRHTTPAHNTETKLRVPVGQREYYRHPLYRKVLWEATRRSFEPPTAQSQFRETDNWTFRRNPTTGALEKAFPPIQDQLGDLISCIREGASKSPSPGKGRSMVQDPSGNWVHVREALLSAKREGRDVPLEWREILRTFHAGTKKKLPRSKATSRSSVPFRAARSAWDKTGRTPRTTRPITRPQKRAPRSEGSDELVKSSTQRPKVQSLLDKGLGMSKDDPGAGQPELRGYSKSKKEKKPSSIRPTRGSAGSQRPKKSGATTRASRSTLTIRDPFDKDTGVRQGFSASLKLGSEASYEKTPVTSAFGSKIDTRGRSREMMRRPRFTTKRLDLGFHLLNAAPEPELHAHQREGPYARTPASEDASARPRRKKSQKSSSGKILSDLDTPVSNGSGRPPTGSGPRNRKAGKPEPKTCLQLWEKMFSNFCRSFYHR